MMWVFPERSRCFRRDPSYEFLELAGKIKDAVSFGIGQPFHLPPIEVFSGLSLAGEGVSGYSPALGFLELRERLAEFLGEKHGVELKAGNVAVTAGATSALYMSLALLVGDGTPVYIQDPSFPVYRDVAEFLGGKLYYWRAGFSGGFEWKCPWESARSGGGVVVVNFPNNPSGSAWSRGLLECLAGEAAGRGLVVVSDEVYEDFVYEGRHYSVLEFPDLMERAVYVGSFSKTWGLAGFRLGYVVADSGFIERLENAAISMYGSPPTYSQVLALRALDLGLDWFGRIKEEYRSNRDLLVEGLSRLPGVEAYRPRGSFYVFPRVRGLAERLGAGDSRSLAYMLLERVGVVALPGDAYSVSIGRDHLRFSFSLRRERIIEGLERLRRFAEEL
jgi:aspartate aminotransferase